MGDFVRDRQNLSPNRIWQLLRPRDRVQLCVLNMDHLPTKGWRVQQPGFLRSVDACETAARCWHTATILLDYVIDATNRQSIEEFRAFWIDAIASSIYHSPSRLLTSHPGNIPSNAGQVLVGAFALHRTLAPQRFPLCRCRRYSLPQGPQLMYACLLVSEAAPHRLQLLTGAHPLVWS